MSVSTSITGVTNTDFDVSDSKIYRGLTETSKSALFVDEDEGQQQHSKNLRRRQTLLSSAPFLAAVPDMARNIRVGP